MTRARFHLSRIAGDAFGLAVHIPVDQPFEVADEAELLAAIESRRARIAATQAALVAENDPALDILLRCSARRAS